MVSRIGQIEASIVARLSAAMLLPGQQLPKIEVRAWPENPALYKALHPQGAVLVLYKRSRFEGMEQELEFEVAVIARTLREPNPSSTEGLGAYDLLETCRLALNGWTPEQASQPISLTSESFEAYGEGNWSYALTLKTGLVNVPADAQCLTEPWVPFCCTDAPELAGVTPPADL